MQLKTKKSVQQYTMEVLWAEEANHELFKTFSWKCEIFSEIIKKNNALLIFGLICDWEQSTL